jgi:hypothetical protein
MSNISSTQYSNNSQSQTMSMTLASKELGIFVTLVILHSFVLIKLFDIRPLCSCVSAR